MIIVIRTIILLHFYYLILKNKIFFILLYETKKHRLVILKESFSKFQFIYRWLLSDVVRHFAASDHSSSTPGNVERVDLDFEVRGFGSSHR